MAKSKQTIVFLVAHPDDVAFFMGGTALLLKDKYKLHVICASRGERGPRFPSEPPHRGPGLPPPDRALGIRREKEEKAACAMLGADLSFLGALDGEIFAGQDVCKKAARLFSKLKPKAIFTHWPLQKPDHAATWNIAWQAIHLAGLFWTTEFYTNLTAGEERNFPKPDIYVNISSVFEKKMEMSRCHQHKCDDAWIQHLTDDSALLGKLACCEYAEAYAAALPMIAVRWKRKAGSILTEIAV